MVQPVQCAAAYVVALRLELAAGAPRPVGAGRRPAASQATNRALRAGRATRPIAWASLEALWGAGPCRNDYTYTHTPCHPPSFKLFLCLCVFYLSVLVYLFNVYPFCISWCFWDPTPFFYSPFHGINHMGCPHTPHREKHYTLFPSYSRLKRRSVRPLCAKPCLTTTVQPCLAG